MTATQSSFSELTKEISSEVMEATTMLAINKSLVKARYKPAQSVYPPPHLRKQQMNVWYLFSSVTINS